ncbi:MAG: CRISPR-associated endonuclease Cas2 [Candidatus Accumulibacter meliphilus]|jgi:CRISPR-associated endonuclease Cas2|uniref:CRISPR-associated endonuclease Cas2 n=1 Tax=Candidatus Accumulibacter meliphilus TaxID=2211374 RepID=UPI002FC2EAA8
MPHWLITTDIAQARRLRRAARICERVGQRVQESVYLMELSPEELRALQGDLARVLCGAEDSVRYYPLCRLDLLRSAGEGLCRGLAAPPGHWII